MTVYLYVLLYLLTYLKMLFIPSCGFELLSGVIFFQPERLPLLFHLRQMCQQQILLIFVEKCVYFSFMFGKIVLFYEEFLLHSFYFSILYVSFCFLLAFIISDEMLAIVLSLPCTNESFFFCCFQDFLFLFDFQQFVMCLGVDLFVLNLLQLC